jgi:hypothetical protein
MRHAGREDSAVSEGDRRTIEQLSNERNQMRWSVEAAKETISAVLALPDHEVGQQARAMLQTRLESLETL